MKFINTTNFAEKLFTVLWVMGLLLVTACRDKQVSDGQVTNIDLTSPTQKRLNMSEFVSGIQYIPLETSDDNLMGNVDQLLFAHNKIIIVTTRPLPSFSLTTLKAEMCFIQPCNFVGRILRWHGLKTLTKKLI